MREPKAIPFEGGPLEGRSFVLPPATVEIRVVGKATGDARYQVAVRDAGVFAMWIGNLPPSTTNPSDGPRVTTTVQLSLWRVSTEHFGACDGVGF
jgi:hypothetical protein